MEIKLIYQNDLTSIPNTQIFFIPIDIEMNDCLEGLVGYILQENKLIIYHNCELGNTNLNYKAKIIQFVLKDLFN